MQRSNGFWHRINPSDRGRRRFPLPSIEEEEGRGEEQIAERQEGGREFWKKMCSSGFWNHLGVCSIRLGFKFWDGRVGFSQYRMQKLAQEQNDNIEKVNRERKYHKQNTAYELNALSTQWKELCQKNIDIQAACASIENHIKELRREATERGWNLDAVTENGPTLHSES